MSRDRETDAVPAGTPVKGQTTGKGGTEPVAADARGKERINTLLARTKSLTGIARAGWITVILGSLYVWLTLAALDDVEIFIPLRQLDLPIVGTSISADGFFLFAPLLVLTVFLYFQFMLLQLFRTYADLCAEGSGDGCRIKGVSVQECVEPWFMSVLIPGGSGGFRVLRTVFAHVMCWVIAPATILAVGWRYLAAHDLWLTAYHCTLLSIALTFALIFEVSRVRLFSGDDGMADGGQPRPVGVTLGVAAAIALLAVVFLFGARGLMQTAWPFADGLLSRLSPHAALQRVELSRKPGNWNEARWLEINASIEELENRLVLGPVCARSDPDAGTPACPTAEDIQRDLAKHWREREMLLSMIQEAELGHIPAAWVLPSAAGAGDDEGAYANGCRDVGDLLLRARDLRFANLRRADLTDAKLRCTDFRNADLREAELESADLTHAKLQRANLAHANLTGAELSYAEMEGVGLRKARMAGSNLEYARLVCDGPGTGDRVMGTCADLTEARLANAGLRGAVLTGADLTKVALEEADLGDADMSAAVLREAKLIGATLNHARLGAADLSGAYLADARLVRAHLVDADLSRADLSGADLTGANLTRANLIGAMTAGTSFEGTKFDGVKVADPVRGVDLGGADLSWAALKGVDLSRSGVTGAQVARAFGDGSVTLPEGVAMPDHWPRGRAGAARILWAVAWLGGSLPQPAPGFDLDGRMGSGVRQGAERANGRRDRLPEAGIPGSADPPGGLRALRRRPVVLRPVAGTAWHKSSFKAHQSTAEVSRP